MTNPDPLANQLESLIATVVDDLERRLAIVISPESVANKVDLLIDPGSTSPALKTYASIMKIRESTRAYLRRRHDPVKKIEDQITSGMDDMFSDHLQPWYPVKREGEAVYVRREHMTAAEVDRCARRMRRAGSALLAHADALEAWAASSLQAS